MGGFRNFRLGNFFKSYFENMGGIFVSCSMKVLSRNDFIRVS